MKDQEKDVYQACKEDPNLIFTLIKQGEVEIIYRLIHENIVSINVVDSVGNDVVTRLLKAREYDLVFEIMKKKNWNVNHQNSEGNTFGHILATDDSIQAVRIFEQLTRKKNYLPNIKNKKGETALDLAINNHYLCCAFKILEDKRFNDIDVNSFKNLFNVCIKNRFYGKYSKINNLEIIVENLEKKELIPSMMDLIHKIIEHMEVIKKEIMNNKSTILESLINSYIIYA